MVVIEAVEQMDLEAFYGAYRDDGRSRPAYDPSRISVGPAMLGKYVFRLAQAEFRGGRLGGASTEEPVFNAKLRRTNALQTLIRVGGPVA